MAPAQPPSMLRYTVAKRKENTTISKGLRQHGVGGRNIRESWE